MTARPAWHHDAPCKGAVELFFPELGQWRVAAKAKAICRTCPYRRPCLEWGIDEIYGVWGGTSRDEREAIKRARARKAAS